MLTSGRVGHARLRAGSLAWRSAIAVFFLAAAAPAEAGDGNWSGFYAGVNAGGTWGNTDTNIGCDSSASGIPDFCADAAAEGAFPFSMSNDLDGFIGGAQIGYNFQRGLMVLGVEADIAWTSIDGSSTVSTGPTASFPESNVVRLSQGLDWLATVRGRLGYSVHNNLLLYATGGLAFGDVNHAYTFDFSGGDFARASKSETRTGWTLGGGGEYSFGQWSLKGEYLYYDLGEESSRAQFVEAGVPLSVYQYPDVETQGHIIRAGLNFKFGHRSREPVPLK